jgi:hypothetical protein
LLACFLPITSVNNRNRNAPETPKSGQPPLPLDQARHKVLPRLFPSVFFFSFLFFSFHVYRRQTRYKRTPTSTPTPHHSHCSLYVASEHDRRAGKLGPRCLHYNDNKVRLPPLSFLFAFFESFVYWCKRRSERGRHTTTPIATSHASNHVRGNFPIITQPTTRYRVGRESQSAPSRLLFFSFAYLMPRIAHTQYRRATSAHHGVVTTHARHRLPAPCTTPRPDPLAPTGVHGAPQPPALTR